MSEQSETVIDLHPVSGLPLTLAPASLALRFGADVTAPEPVYRRADDMRSVLLDSAAAEGDDIVYAVYRGLATEETAAAIRQRGLLYAALILREGRVGSERVRTRGHTNSPASGTSVPYPEVHEVWHGRALVYLQAEAARDVSDVAAAELGPGDKIVVPPGWASLIANIGDTALALGTWRTEDCVPQYAALEALGGMAHFVLAEGAGYGFEPNPHYRSVPVPRRKAARDFPEFGLHRSEPMFMTFRRNPDFLSFMTRPQDHDRAWAALYGEAA